MTTTQSIPSLAEQVRAALDSWTEIHEHAEAAAAAYGELKRLVGSNETERKERKAATPAETYAEYVLHLATAETEHAAAKAAEERSEKALNTLREMLNSETALIARNAAFDFASGASELNRAVDAYRRSTGTKPLMSEIRRRVDGLTLQPAGDIREEDLPF